MKKCYVAGPINGLEINEVEKNFKRGVLYCKLHLPYEPVNPLDITPLGSSKSYEEILKLDLKGLLKCDAILLLIGWEHSKGANIEFQVAKAVGMEIYFMS